MQGLGVVVYAALSVVVYTRASLVPSSGAWIVGAQAVFVTWTLVLFFMVVGRCLDLRRTASRADTVRSLLATHVRLRRHLAGGSESSGFGGSAAVRQHLRLLRRQMEIVSYDGGFPMTTRRQNDATATADSSSPSSSSSNDFVPSTDSLHAFLYCHDAAVGRRESGSGMAVDGVDVEVAPGSLERASGSEHEVRDVHPALEPNVGASCSPTRCSQQTWVFFDNRPSSAPGNQLLADIASGCLRRSAFDTTSGFDHRQRGLRSLWWSFCDGRRRLYEYLRAEAAEWLGISGQLRLMSEHRVGLPHRSSKSRLARSRSRASNISGGQRTSNYHLARSFAECGGLDFEDRKSRIVTSASRLSESTCTELSLLSVSALTGSCPIDDDREISRDETERLETGYAADTEREGTRYPEDQRLRLSRDRTQHHTPSSDLSDNSTSGPRIDLPTTKSRRLRMRRHIPDVTLLRRSMRATVAIAFATLSVCGLQVYAVLGIYGVLSNERTVESLWAWLAFQSLSR